MQALQRQATVGQLTHLEVEIGIEAAEQRQAQGLRSRGRRGRRPAASRARCRARICGRRRGAWRSRHRQIGVEVHLVDREGNAKPRALAQGDGGAAGQPADVEREIGVAQHHLLAAGFDAGLYGHAAQALGGHAVDIGAQPAQQSAQVVRGRLQRAAEARPLGIGTESAAERSVGAARQLHRSAGEREGAVLQPRRDVKLAHRLAAVKQRVGAELQAGGEPARQPGAERRAVRRLRRRRGGRRNIAAAAAAGRLFLRLKREQFVKIDGLGRERRGDVRHLAQSGGDAAVERQRPQGDLDGVGGGLGIAGADLRRHGERLHQQRRRVRRCTRQSPQHPRQVFAFRLQTAAQGTQFRVARQRADEGNLSPRLRQLQRKRQCRGAGFNQLTEIDIERQRHTLVVRRAAGGEGSGQGLRGELGIQAADRFLATAARVAVAQGAVLNEKAIDADRLVARRRSIGTRGLAGRVRRPASGPGLTGRELPVGPPVLQHFQQHLRPHQGNAFDPHLAAQQRQQRDTDLEFVQRHHRRGRAPVDVRQRDVAGRKSRGRQQPQADLAGDGEVAPGMRLDQSGHAALLGVPVPEARQHQESACREHDQQNQCKGELLHACTSIPAPPPTASPLGEAPARDIATPINCAKLL